ncbi:hypothetical protein JCM10207_007535 [Rhodosporidiobolus poonsookiae]
MGTYRPPSPRPSYKSLPTSSYDAAPPPSLGTGRLRPASLFLFTLLGTFLLFSFAPSSPRPHARSFSLFDHALRPFRRAGLNDALYPQLSGVDHRAVIIHAVERPFEQERRQDDPVRWSENDLFPRRSEGAERIRASAAPAEEGDASGERAVVNWDPVPVHTVDALPRRVALDIGQPGVYGYLPETKRMLFGIVTTVKRAKEMSKLWTRWMVPDVADRGGAPVCLVLLSAEEDPKDVEDLKQLFVERALPCGVRIGKYERYEVRVLSMVNEMREYAQDIGKSIDWFVFNDDDTYWLDLRAARRMLSKYDPSQFWLIGSSTEATDQRHMFGRMAFGGAGILVSNPLLAAMQDRWDECHAQFKDVFGGDDMVTQCAALTTGRGREEVTTQEEGLHQFDIMGDTSGVFQSGIPLLTLHHFMGGGWVRLFAYGSPHSDMAQIERIGDAAAFLGGDNMFRRYVFGRGRWVMVNGYSITLYEKPLSREDLGVIEHTWYAEQELLYQDRPHIPERHSGDGTPAKQTFFIESTELVSPDTALFTYLQADSWDEQMPADERVRIQVLWEAKKPPMRLTWPVSVSFCDAHYARALSPHQHQHVARAPAFAVPIVELEKRQETAPGAAQQAGTANPEPNQGELNNFKVELPSKGSADGGIAAFNKRALEVRQAGAPGAKEAVGASNPTPADGDLNNRGDNTPVKSTPGGGMTDFTKRSPSAAAFAHPVPRADQLNWAPHHLATRGRGGKIELFSA